VWALAPVDAIRVEAITTADPARRECDRLSLDCSGESATRVDGDPAALRRELHNAVMFGRVARLVSLDDVRGSRATHADGAGAQS